MSYVGI